MRLWHQNLIPLLPRQQLLGQHRECCALRGAGWGRKHSVVNYVFTHKPADLIAYHYLIMNEMEKRQKLMTFVKNSEALPSLIPLAAPATF